MKTIKWGIKPYSNGSGFEYVVTLRESADEQPTIIIKSAGGECYIKADDWDMLRDEISNLEYFMRHGQGRGNDAR